MTATRPLFAFAALVLVAASGSAAALADEGTDCPTACISLPELTFGIGATLQHTELDTGVVGRGVGLLGRVELGQTLTLEGEVSRVEYEENRLDWTAGGTLLLSVARRDYLTAFALAGAGLILVDAWSGSWSGQQVYGEAGAGAAYAVTETMDLTFDIRWGKRAVLRRSSDVYLQTMIVPPVPNEETATRARIGLVRRF
jgi:hypothetical protein